jgi:hypothetical protein
MPHDGIGARAIAAWLVEARVRELLVIHDHDEDYGVSVGAMCVEEARARGLVVRSRPVWNHDEPAADDLGEAGAVLHVGVAGSGAIGLWRDLHAHDRSMWLLGAGGDRVGTAAVARATRDRDSLLGRYSIDEEGHTTTSDYGRLAVVDGALVWDG